MNAMNMDTFSYDYNASGEHILDPTCSIFPNTMDFVSSFTAAWLRMGVTL